ncbi:MAG: hypothetical protein WBK55_02060 [Alphaproteobacteria bacterium]
MPKKSPTSKSRAQPDKFVQAAKEHGCDESEKAFDEKLKKISKTELKSEQLIKD